MSFLSKKGLATILIIGIVVPTGVVLVPQQTQAQIPPAPGIQVPVADTFNFPFHFFEANKEAGLDGVVFVAMKTIIDKMTSSIIDWVNSGFDGEPAFVVNETEFISRVSTQIFGDIYNETLTKYNSAPFVGVLAQSLIDEYSEGYSDKEYTLDQDVEDVDAFLAGDFSKGGWSGWYSLTQKPENNIFGARQQTKQEYQERVAVAQDLITNDLNRNNGFFSQRDSSGNIVTPGSVIESQLENVLGSGVRQLELADEFNELIGALVGQLTNKLLTEYGLSGVSSDRSNDPNSGLNYLEQLLIDRRELQNPNNVLDYTVPSTGVPAVNPNNPGNGSGGQEGVYCFDFNVLGETSKDRKCYSSLNACQQDRKVFSDDTDLKVGICQKI